MKNVILIAVAVVFFLYVATCPKKQSATKDDLEKVKNELKMQIDSVLRDCDSLKNELRAVRANTDTLKAGQEVIFKTMQENKDKQTTLWDLIKW